MNSGQVTIAFLWITWAVAVVTALLLFIADSELRRFTRPTALSGDAPTSVALVDFNHTEVKRASPDRPPLLHRRAGDAGVNTSKESEIQEVPIGSEAGQSAMLREGDGSEESVSLPRASLEAPLGEEEMSHQELRKN